jgi:hypothetical protein
MNDPDASPNATGNFSFAVPFLALGAPARTMMPLGPGSASGSGSIVTTIASAVAGSRGEENRASWPKPSTRLPSASTLNEPAEILPHRTTQTS